MFLSSRWTPCCLGAVSTAFLAALADVAVARQATPALVPAVVVSGAGLYDARRDDTAAKIVVGAEELAKYGDASVAEALKRVPGVTVSSTGRGVDIRLRGLGSGYTQILLNGERIAAGFSIDTLSPSQVERIDIIRSATADLSTDAVAGTINIILKKTTPRAQRQLQLGYGGTPGERTPRAVLLLADRAGPLSYSLGANSRITWNNRDNVIDDSVLAHDGQRVTAWQTRSHDTLRFSTFNLLPRLSWTSARGDTVTWDSALSYTTLVFDAQRHSAALAGPPPDFTAQDWRIGTRSAAARSDLGWSARLSPTTKMELKLGLQQAQGENDSSRKLFATTAAAAPTTSNRQRVHNDDRGGSTSGKLVGGVTGAHQPAFGWEVSRLRREEMLDETTTGAAQRTTAFTAVVLRAAAFAQDEWTITPHWSLYLGARIEYFATTIDAGAPLHVGSRIGSPIAQTLIKLPGLPQEQLRIALTRTFKAPDLGSLIPRRRRYELNASTNPDLDGNPLLRPEIARGVDVTWEHRFGKAGLLSAGLSHRHIDAVTLPMVEQDADGRWVSRPVNAGGARSYGLELEARFALTALRPSLPGVELRASLSRNWSFVDQVPGPHNRLAQQVPLQATLSADHSIGAWTTGASLVLRQGGWTQLSASQNTLAETRRDLDLYLLWKATPTEQLRFTIGNLLRRDDITATRYRSAQDTATRTIITPGLLSVRALLEHRF